MPGVLSSAKGAGQGCSWQPSLCSQWAWGEGAQPLQRALETCAGDSLVIRWLGLGAFTVTVLGLIPGRKPLQYSCLENFHGQRSLMGYSP